MDRTRWFFHPILVFIFSIAALGLSLFLYIYWYMEVSTGLESIIRRFNLDSGQVLESETWVVILVLSILVAIILLGIFTIFVYNQKTLQLYRLQNNFINSFTHELKTPVTSMRLFLETLLKHDLSREDQHKYIRYMILDIGRLSDNINRILDLARLESKSYKANFAVTDPVKAIRRFVESNQPVFRDLDILIKPPARDDSRCQIDLSLFDMLLMNIFTNAVKYNKSETPRIEISFEIGTRRFHIRFKDNGIGLEKIEIKKIFRKFYQVGRADDMSAKGSGLGLHLVQNITRIHRGRMKAESPGRKQGTTFILSLPLCRQRSALS